MRDLKWLMELPGDDPVYNPLRRALEMDPEHGTLLARAHERALRDAATGADVRYRSALRLVKSLHREPPADESEALARELQQVEALGYALGATAVQVAIREHDGFSGRAFGGAA